MHSGFGSEFQSLTDATHPDQYIAAKLLEINERGTWVDPKTLSTDNPASKKKLIEQDEEIFQTARLVNAGWFGSGKSTIPAVVDTLTDFTLLPVVFSDYFSCILGLVRDGNNWSLSPFEVGLFCEPLRYGRSSLPG